MKKATGYGQATGSWFLVFMNCIHRMSKTDLLFDRRKSDGFATPNSYAKDSGVHISYSEMRSNSCLK